MMKKLMLGNDAVARGAYEAGVHVVSSYPGTPSTEITEFAATYDDIACEWAPNEKVAMEAITTGAFNTGANVLAGMAQEGAANNAVAGTVNTMEPGGADTKAQAVNHATDVAKAYFESIGKGGNK